jgi:hypothetical protein
VKDDLKINDMKVNSSKIKPPFGFWVISIIALLWFLMDLSAFAMRVFMLEESLATMPENQQQLYVLMPQWVNFVFAAEVFGGVLGSLLLLVKKRWALPLFIVSIIGVIGQTFYVYFLSDAISLMGTPAIVMPLLAIAIGISIIVFTKSAIAKNWLH